MSIQIEDTTWHYSCDLSVLKGCEIVFQAQVVLTVTAFGPDPGPTPWYRNSIWPHFLLDF